MTEIPTMSTRNNISVMDILNNFLKILYTIIYILYTIVSLFVHSEQVLKLLRSIYTDTHTYMNVDIHTRMQTYTTHIECEKCRNTC